MTMIAKAPRTARLALLAPLALLAACAQPAGEQAGQAVDAKADMKARNGGSEPVIPAEFKALGTEPFWALTATGSGTPRTLRYSTPDNIDGTPVTIEDEAADGSSRRIGGTLDGKAFALLLTVEQCSDGMSDRIYPFAAQVVLGEQTLRGCARPTDS